MILMTTLLQIYHGISRWTGLGSTPILFLQIFYMLDALPVILAVALLLGPF